MQSSLDTLSILVFPSFFQCSSADLLGGIPTFPVGLLPAHVSVPRQLKYKTNQHYRQSLRE